MSKSAIMKPILCLFVSKWQNIEYGILFESLTLSFETQKIELERSSY